MSKKNLVINFLVFGLLFGFIALGCSPASNSEQQPEEVAEKLLFDSDLMDSLINQVQQVLVTNLSYTIEQKGIEEAALFCSNQAQFLTDSVSRNIGYTVRRISDKHRNPLNHLSAYEQEVMLAFARSKEEGNLLYSQIDEVNKMYYKPILLGMPVCLKCHGDADERDADAYAVIQANYPDDHAVNYKLGDLRGMWVVDFSAK